MSKSNTTPTIRQAISYGRFSSIGQEEGESTARQKAAYNEVCSHYSDRIAPSTEYGFGHFFGKGESGFSAEHLADGGSLASLLSALESGAINPHKTCLVIEAFDRLGRMEPDIATALLSRLVRMGCALAVARPRVFIGNVADLNGSNWFLVQAMLVLAHEESKQKSERGQHNWRVKREAGAAAVNTRHDKGSKSRACPSWLQRSPDGKTYVPNDFAQVIKEMFRLALEGHGAKTIQGMLKLEGVCVLGYLRDRQVIGEHQPMKRVGKSTRVPDGLAIPNYYPAIITDDIFFTVQTGLDSRRKQRGRKGKFVTNLFKELCYGDDGKKMYIKGESRGRRMLTRRTPGRKRAWDYKAIEAGILLELRDVSLQPATATVKDYVGILNDLSRRIDELTELQAELPSRANAVALSKLEARVEEVQAEYEAEKGKVAPPVALLEAQTLLGQLDGLTGDDLLLARTRVAACMARLLKRINVTIRESIHGTPECVVWLAFVDGTVRVFSIENVGRKAAKYVYTGLCGADGMPGQDCQATATVGDKTVTVDFDWADKEAESIVAYAS